MDLAEKRSVFVKNRANTGLFFGHFSEFSLGGKSRNIEFFDFFREFLKNCTEFLHNSVRSLHKTLSFSKFCEGF